MTRTIVSWNVNGLRPRHAQNEFLPLFRHNPDIVCIQEAKTLREKIPDEIKRLHGYHIICAPVPQGNFTEVMLFSRTKPVSVRYGFGTPPFDGEGRIILADFETFVLVNIYFPLGIAPVDTLEHKLAFYDNFLGCAGKLRHEGRPVILCGDFSIAHTDDDVESVKKHAARQVGTTPAEREKIANLINMGYSDVHRIFLSGKGHYTWWPNGFKIPERHLGRRLDYFYANERAKTFIVDAEILSGVEGSDHCPIQMDLEL
jgi:exodeoxyribonuclease-3